MSANKDTPTPAIILLLALLNGSSSFLVRSDPSGTNHTATLPLRPRGHNYDMLELNSYDYYDDASDPPGQRPFIPTQKPSPQPCAYDLCRELQTPCYQLAVSSGCLCPGETGPHEVPEAPRIRRLTTNESTVVAQWCAPESVVTRYYVTVGNGLRTFAFGPGNRTGAIGEVNPGEEVCVVAVNDRGSSHRHIRSCIVYNPRGNDSLALKASLIGGTLGLLVLLSLGLLLWRHRAQRKADARITHATEETL
ncbi:hypothetical protein DPEC_G00239150 [Dallia pectoralis]|uniref:Uncharacterized protein n=1 Tax=Dallia pectoralis TaxID=75939 RepID=A0ACC2FZ40_DALPE|nr:hypothetical protein DPEC_G00239150 [Dallia pectoralis]